MGVVSLDLSLLMVFTSVANCKYLVRFIITGKLVNSPVFSINHYIPGVDTFLIVSFASDTVGPDFSTIKVGDTRGVSKHEGIATQPPVPRADVLRSASLIVFITAPFITFEAA